MAIVKPGAPKAQIFDTPAGVELNIPAPRYPFVVVFLPVWLVGWAFGWFTAFSAIGSRTSDPGATLFMVVWLSFWTLGGGFALAMFAWSLAGREIVVLGPGRLAIAWRVFGVGRVREYDLVHAARLRVAPQPYNPYDYRSGMRFWGIGGGPIAFDYGASTIRFGGALQEAEASALVQRLIERQPSLRGVSP